MTNINDNNASDPERKEGKQPPSGAPSGNSGQPPHLRPSTNSGSAADIALAYVARGWKPIPIPIGEKGCKDNDWDKITYDANRHFDGLKNIGVQLGPVSGGLTDVDLDVAEAIKLAPYFLPRTAATFGRQSKPESHWLYLIDDPEASAAIKLVDETEKKKAIIELRMGGGGKGALTVFPGSAHQSGELVEWVKTGEPAKSSCAILKAAVIKIAIATLLVRHWPENNRHDASMRCGGFLARAGWTPEDIQDFMRPVQQVAGVYNDTHVRGGCSAAFDAATLHVTEGKGYGLPAFKEFFGAEVTKVIAKILHYRERDQTADLERLNEKYCIIPFGSKVRVLAFERELNRSVLTFYSAADFKLLYDNILINLGEGIKPIGMGKWWIYHPLRRQYEGLVFAPRAPRVIDGRLLNLWQGWGIAPHKGCWKRLRRHIFKVLANGNKASAKYIIKWTAWAFQHPDLMAEAAIVLRGGQGTGKGVWCRLLCNIFGQHGIQISSHNHLIGKHNKHLLDCALLFADEAFWPGDKSAEGTLKRIVTEDTLPIEPKFVDMTLHVNRLHVVLASNQDWVVPAALDDRRFAVFDLSDKYQKDKDYFEPLYQEIKNGGGAAMLYDLLQMNLGSWHPRYDMPKTDALMDQKELSLQPEDQWWYELLKTGILPGSDPAPNPDYPTPTYNPRRARSRNLMDEARKSVPELRFHSSDHKLGRALRKRGCERCKLHGDAAWEFPPLKKARAAWDQKLPGGRWDGTEEWGAEESPM